MSSAVLTHRCRFIDYTPTPIAALAFPPFPSIKKNDQSSSSSEKFDPENNFLAVGRLNGNIEIHTWSASNSSRRSTWSLRMILSGPTTSKVDALAFSLKANAYKYHGLQKYRLFSSAGTNEVIEWDLSTGLPRQSLSSQGGSIWSMAMNPTSTHLALGCEDGAIRIVSLENDELVHWRRLDRVKTRLLSLAWGPPIIPQRHENIMNGRNHEDSEEEDINETENWQDSFILAGCSDSSIRKFDVQSGRSLERMTLDKLRGERTLVWAISVLADGTFASGDSLGNVKFWDSVTGTQLHSFIAHGADVLCLTVGQDGNTIYSSGVDQKICQFSKIRIENSRTKSSMHKWVNTGSKRVHCHDVKAIGAWPPYTPVPSHRSASPTKTFLASGGLDMSLIICPISEPIHKSDSFILENLIYERVPYKTCFSNPVQLARRAKLILCRRTNSLTLWRFNITSRQEDEPDADSDNQNDAWEEIIEMELQLKHNLVASAISNDGAWVAASSLSEIKLFRLIDHKGVLKPKSVPLHGESELANMGATSLCFTDDSQKLIVGGAWSSSKLYVVDLDSGDGTPRLLRCFEQHRMHDIVIAGDADSASDQKNDHLSLSHQRHKCTALIALATSVDGQWLASSDDLHRIHIYNLDSLQHHCALPSFPHPVVSIAFDPLDSSLLVTALANNSFQVFDVEAREFPQWSINLEGNASLETLRDPIIGVTFDTQADTNNAKEGRYVVLWGNSWICKVRLGSTYSHFTSKKRRRDSRQFSLNKDTNALPQSGNQGEELRIVRKYRPLLLAGFIGPGELVVVERPLMDLLSSLPPAYYKPKYGT